MRQLLAIIMLTIILTPIIFQIVFTIRKIKGKTNLSILMIFLWTLVLVILSSFCGTMLFLGIVKYYNNSEQPSDINGVQFFIFFGILTALIISPSIGIVGWISQYLKKKKIMEQRNG